jgi:hypothetical protein
MIKEKSQQDMGGALLHGLGTSIKNVADSLLSGQNILAELSGTAAHYDGLIDSIERAGWDITKLEKIKHAFDDAAQSLLNEVLDSYPDMSDVEQRSFLAPFQRAIHQFSQMTARERDELKQEYARFAQLQAQSVRVIADQEALN